MAELKLTGSNLIDGAFSNEGAECFRAFARPNGDPLEPEFSVAVSSEVAAAVTAADRAFGLYSALPASRRADFLSAIASQIEALGDALIGRASAESGLPIPRLVGERGRTCGQLRMFAALIREGSWVEARIDLADPHRTPPKPDLRRMLVPLGPVAVFGASNFPLAFSVAGGDTASALAAGCPVVVKAHPAHPGTSEMVAAAVAAAARETGMPNGVLSMLHGGAEVGQALVKQPEIYAVGFTGSKAAGRALYDLAATRPRPIPVYAEMGSVNPIFILPGALSERGEAIGRGYAESLSLGVGQFCTNPGLVVGLAGDAFDQFLAVAAATLAGVAPGLMLTDDICRRFQSAVSNWGEDASLESVFIGDPVADRAIPALFKTSASKFLDEPRLAEEVFGPAGIAIACDSFAEMLKVAEALEGQLTGSIHMAGGDRVDADNLIPVLNRGVGRLVFNGFPTGVEVGSAMQHGGPYPATTDSRSTSVGTAAILRFARPVAFQNMPAELLPAELQDANPQGIWRLVDGVFGREAL